MPKNTKENAYADERIAFTKNMLDILGYDKNNIQICFNKILYNEDIKEKMQDLLPKYKKYFYISNISSSRNPLLSMFKNVLKQMEYTIYSEERNTKIVKGRYENLRLYTIIPPTVKQVTGY